MSMLQTKAVDEIRSTRSTPVDEGTLDEARKIIDEVRRDGDAGLRACIERFERRYPEQLVFSSSALEAAFHRLDPSQQGLLSRTKERIASFAVAQKACLSHLKMSIPGGHAGHHLAPVESAACYAPGGRFPLPSSVLMTAATARAAGVNRVVVVTPSSDDIMLGAAFVAGADQVLLAGGAHAVAAVTYGTETVQPVDVVVGPGNRWVTAAKSLVSGQVGIDMLAGPSELLVVAGDDACPQTVAADLLAQAEHDVDARPILVTKSRRLISDVNGALVTQLETLATAAIAAEAMANGFAVLCETDQEIIAAVDLIAPEHLELLGADAEALADDFKHYGGLFIGTGTAEVLGDYGAGPNHTLPTGGTARFAGGLSVFDFIRIRTWMRLDDQSAAQPLVKDAMALAQVEGLAGHSCSAGLRRT